jgi:hypothetical protein
MAQLTDIAPRLARARDAYLIALRQEDTERLRLICLISDIERLVAHRDLQLIRSESRGRARRNAKYMAYRQRKLANAEARLIELRDQLAHIADWRKTA